MQAVKDRTIAVSRGRGFIIAEQDNRFSGISNGRPTRENGFFRISSDIAFGAAAKRVGEQERGWRIHSPVR